MENTLEVHKKEHEYPEHYKDMASCWYCLIEEKIKKLELSQEERK